MLSAMLLAGCYNLRISLPEGVDSTERFALSTLKGANLDHFSETQGTTYLFWGIVSPAPVDPEQVLAPYLRGGSRISNLTISSHHSFTDALVMFLTLGIVDPLTIRYEGDVVGASAPRRR